MHRSTLIARVSFATFALVVFVAFVGAPAATRGQSPPRPLVEGSRALMGTIFRVGLSGVPDDPRAHAAIERALDEAGRLESLLSEWRETSEISRVNANAGIAPVRVGPELLACVQGSLDVARWSHGAFDISWAALRGLWDFGPESAHVPPSRADVRARLGRVDYRKIVVDPHASTVFLRERGMAIGLGGIAKGYALDRMAAILEAAGYRDHLLFGGGQVLVGGRREGRGWRVGIQHPRMPDRYFGFVEVSGRASVATSGDYEHSFEHGGRRFHHILDPRTGFPSMKSASVTLISTTAFWADAVDTAVFLLGPRRGIDALRTAPGGPHEAVVVDSALRLSTTPGTERRLVMRAAIDPRTHRLERFLSGDEAPQTLPPLPPR